MSSEQSAPGEFQPSTQPRLDGPYEPPRGPAIAAAFPFDDIEELAERIVALSKDRARGLELYLKHLICREEP